MRTIHINVRSLSNAADLVHRASAGHDKDQPSMTFRTSDSAQYVDEHRRSVCVSERYIVENIIH